TSFRYADGPLARIRGLGRRAVAGAVATSRGEGADVAAVRQRNCVGRGQDTQARGDLTMAEEVTTRTYGFDHVGLSVRDLASSRKFFCDCLGWAVVGERPDYPAAFVSDGRGILTQWQ